MRKRKRMSKHTMVTRAARAREIRDLYNKLRRKYRPQVVAQFFQENYFLQMSTVEQIIRESDSQSVDTETASIIYKTAIQDNFHL